MFSKAKDKVVKYWIWYLFFVSLSTELLSILDLITRVVLLKIYLFGLAVIFCLILFQFKKLKFRFQFKLSKYWVWYLVLILIVFLPLFLIALYYPPNNWDSMTYHLPRVEHWIQNKNVEFYPTNNDRQLFMSPLDEYVILHWRLLINSDVFVNFVQYFSMVLSVILSTLVVKKLGGKNNSELLVAILTATIPIGIMEATSTQNDWLPAFLALATLYFCLKNDIWYIAICVALGFFAKSTYAIFVLPIGIYWFVGQIKICGYKIFRKIILILLMTILINFFQWKRNYLYYGSITGPKYASYEMFNGNFEPKYIVSNMVKNIGTQIGLPNKKYNSAISNIVNTIHKKMGLDVNDYTNSYNHEKYYTQFSIHEDLTGNYVFLVLFVISGLVLLLKKYNFWPYYTVLLSGWILFNFLLKWQPWLSRLELPFFVVSCPILSLVLSKFVKNILFLKTLILLTIGLSLPYVLGFDPFRYSRGDMSLKSNRPLTEDVLLFNKTRYERFLAESSINSSYHEIARKLLELGVKNVKLNIGGDSREYPLWVALKHTGKLFDVSYLEKNVGQKVANEAVIYDDVATELLFNKLDISQRFNFGEVKMIVLK